MANKLRAFISSTMEDLGNERRAVVRTLENMGVVPVYAEALSSNGGTSWEVIQAELARSHLFIVILGDRYGWVPKSGFGAGEGMSVTHLELREAQKLNKPVFAFFKKLPYGAPADPLRDKFRNEISDWSGGVFRQDFEWADDLSEKVWGAITNTWQDSLLRSLVKGTTDSDAEIAPNWHLAPSSIASQGILLAGAGMSVAAGYPTAPFLMRVMANDLWGSEVQSAKLQSFRFSALAGFYESKLGKNALRQCVAKVLDTPQAITPTRAHLMAVKRFKSIITTNYDGLFEQACIVQGLPFQVINPFQNNLPAKRQDVIDIYKLVGSVSNRESMIITDNEILEVAKSNVYKHVSNLIANNELFVIGHGLRDGNIEELLANRPRRLRGTYVSPFADDIDEVLFYRYGLDLVRQNADDFMHQLGTDS